MYTKSDLGSKLARQRLRVIRRTYVPELNLVTSMGNCAVAGAWGLIEEVVKLRASSQRKPGVAGVIPGPVGQKDSRTNTYDAGINSIARSTAGIQ